MYKQNAVRGKVEPADIRIPTASHGGGVYSTVEEEYDLMILNLTII